MPSGLKRFHGDDHYHFITFSCYRRLPYLHNDTARIVFEEQLERLRQKHDFYLFGYVLMPEHVHLLMSEPKRQRLEDTMRVLKGETSKRLKGDRPQFWQRRYHDFNVFTDDKFTEKLRYAHRNPVSRELVERPKTGHGAVTTIGSQATRPGGNRVSLDLEAAPPRSIPHALNLGALFMPEHLGHEWAAHTARIHHRAKIPPCRAV